MADGATVLVTGATGFVGGATAHRLLHDPRVARVLALARPSREQSAELRLRASLERFGPFPRERLTLLAGDLASPGIDTHLRETVTQVIHAAACTSLASRHRVFQTNVEGTRSLLLALDGSTLRRFVYVGTAFRCGARPEMLVSEEAPAVEEHAVPYTQSKALAEREVEASALPWIIARPSIVVGHTRLGVKPSSSLFWLYRVLAQAGVSPFAPARRRDLVPVDWVAISLVELALRPSLSARRFHLSAGEASIRWSEILAAFARAGMAAPRSERVAPEALAAHPALAAYSPRLLTGVAACAQFARLRVDCFDQHQLLAEGIAPAPPASAWFPTCIDTAGQTVEEDFVDEA